MIPYLVFAYKTNVAPKGGIEDCLIVIPYPNDIIATESWIKDVMELVENFKTYNIFQLVRVNPTSTVMLEVWGNYPTESA